MLFSFGGELQDLMDPWPDPVRKIQCTFILSPAGAIMLGNLRLGWEWEQEKEQAGAGLAARSVIAAGKGSV